MVKFWLQENKSHYRTLTKTRKYVIDGQVVTTSTSRIVMSGEENRNKEEHEFRYVTPPGDKIGEYTSGVRFTTRCRALSPTARLRTVTLNLTTNSTIPVSQPLSCLSLSCANLSLSLMSQISQWSSSIETTSSDKSVNRKLQVLNVSGFIKFKSKHSKFFTSRPYINPTMLEMHHAKTQRSFCCRVLFWESCSGIDCVPL